MVSSIWSEWLQIAQHNPLIHELIQDGWISETSTSLPRFFTTKRNLHAWDDLLQKIIRKYNITHILTFKDDIQGLILVTNSCVIKTYRMALFMKIKPVYKIRSLFVEKCLASHVIGRVGVFILEKLDPVLKPDYSGVKGFVNFEQMNHDILRGLRVMHNHGLCHGDVSLDNTGYRPSTGQYVLFDFDRISRIPHETTCDSDLWSWHRSLSTWIPK